MAPPPGWLPSLLLQPYLSSPLWQEPGPPHIHQSHPTPNPLSPPPRLSHQTPESRQVGMAGGGDSKPIPIPSSPPSLLSPFPPGEQTLLKSRPPHPHPPFPSPHSPPRGASAGRGLTSGEMAPPSGTRARCGVGSSPPGPGLPPWSTGSPRLLTGALDRVSYQVSGGAYTR